MPLSDFFAEQFRQIRSFMTDPGQVVRVIRVDPDLKPILIKALAKMDDEPDNVHAMLYADAPFESSHQYFTALLDQLRADHEMNAGILEDQGVRFVLPYSEQQSLHQATRFCMYADALSDALPEAMGSLVFLLDPPAVDDLPGFRQSIDYLAGQVESKWVKFLVMDTRVSPVLSGVEALASVGVQTFYIAPDEIETKLKEQAERSDSPDPAQQRRTLGVLAGFAFSKRNYPEAARLQAEWARLSEEGGAPGEAASAYYNLGNTQLEAGNLLEAEKSFVQSCDLCLEHGVNGVLPLALTNLGVALSRQNRVAEAIEALRVAYQNFKAQNHKPGQAFVFDTMAAVHHAARRDDEAEQAWLAALDIYRGITSSAFADLRESGSNDIVAKLDRFYQQTGRPNRVNEQRQSV
jgi:tetratricopeptide (TPR) repeat protein